MTKRSFGLYVFHYLPLSALALWLDRSGIKIPLLCYLLITAAGFFGGLGLYELISRIPFLRWCVLGMRTEKKHVER